MSYTHIRDAISNENSEKQHEVRHSQTLYECSGGHALVPLEGHQGQRVSRKAIYAHTAHNHPPGYEVEKGAVFFFRHLDLSNRKEKSNTNYLNTDYYIYD